MCIKNKASGTSRRGAREYLEADDHAVRVLLEHEVAFYCKDISVALGVGHWRPAFLSCLLPCQRERQPQNAWAAWRGRCIPWLDGRQKITSREYLFVGGRGELLLVQSQVREVHAPTYVFERRRLAWMEHVLSLRGDAEHCRPSLSLSSRGFRVGMGGSGAPVAAVFVAYVDPCHLHAAEKEGNFSSSSASGGALCAAASPVQDHVRNAMTCKLPHGHASVIWHVEEGSPEYVEVAHTGTAQRKHARRAAGREEAFRLEVAHDPPCPVRAATAGSAGCVPLPFFRWRDCNSAHLRRGRLQPATLPPGKHCLPGLSSS